MGKECLTRNLSKIRGCSPSQLSSGITGSSIQANFHIRKFLSTAEGRSLFFEITTNSMTVRHSF